MARLRRSAFTAIQLVVLLAVLLILLALLAPAVGKVREAAQRTQSMNNMRMLGLAAHSFHDALARLPPTIGKVQTSGPASTHFFLLPFLEHAVVYNRADGKVWNDNIWSEPIAEFLDPQDHSVAQGYRYQDWLATTNYPANWLVFKEGDTKLENIADGTSNTLMFGQRYQLCSGQPTAWGYPEFSPWAPMIAYYSVARFQVAPHAADCDPALAQSPGPALLATFCDGSVHTLRDQVSATTWYRLLDPADGHPLEAFE